MNHELIAVFGFFSGGSLLCLAICFPSLGAVLGVPAASRGEKVFENLLSLAFSAAAASSLSWIS